MTNFAEELGLQRIEYECIEDGPPRDLTVEQWEKKVELSLLNGDLGEAMKYAHYANCSHTGDADDE